MRRWNRQDLENIAKLAKLEIHPDDIQARLTEFADILEYIEVLGEAPVEKTKSDTSSKLEMFDDEEKACLPIEDVLKNATHPDEPFFFIPKFIEGGKS